MKPIVEHLSHEKCVFNPQREISEKAHIQNMDQYERIYRHSIEEPASFWLEQSQSLEWFHPPQKALNYTWDTDTVFQTWFEDGKINVSVNCLDRHLKTPDKIALIWQGDEDEKVKRISYRELHREVCRFANLLKKQGIEKGDRVCIYLPMVLELPIAMLACARIGAVHSVVFGGFSSESLTYRINDSCCKMLITANTSKRGGKTIFFKEIADNALQKTSSIQSVLVFETSCEFCQMQDGRDFFVSELIEGCSDDCPPAVMNAEDPLFILYTSGSTGMPKGVLHTQAGYLLYASLTHKYVFDIHEKDIYWCTADIGWVTGHSYIVYGPLANGATSVMFEGIPTYPDPGRFWHIIDKFRVTVFYTAPTAIRSLIAVGDEFPSQYQLDSLRILGTVGEPINPKTWMWYHTEIGHNRCPIVDTWWQTETGGIMIAPLPGSHSLKPGSASRPFFGVEPVILRDDGTECLPNEGGSLCIKKPWPGMGRTTWGDHSLFISAYFSRFPHLYFTGDSCMKDSDGDYWLLGRLDDVVNVSGHRIGTAEVESALVSHPSVSEAAVVPCPHAIKGQSLYAFVVLKREIQPSEHLLGELKQQVRKEIGPIAIPETIQFTEGLPKTRSGKIMRRVLRKIVAKEHHDLGDISTLADPQIVEKLIEDTA